MAPPLPASLSVRREGAQNLGLNSMFEVYLVGNNSHHFIISPTSVQGKADIRIRVAIPLDYETVDRYDFDLFANESVPDHVGYAKVKITLINENDNRPIFSQPLYNVSLYENVTVGTSVLTVLVSLVPGESQFPLLLQKGRRKDPLSRRKKRKPREV